MTQNRVVDVHRAGAHVVEGAASRTDRARDHAGDENEDEASSAHNISSPAGAAISYRYPQAPFHLTTRRDQRDQYY